MRGILGSGSPPEEELQGLLADRRDELEAQAIALEDAIADLERREGLLRDSRASLERLLRLGTSDLDSRESELADLIRELTEREERLREEEAELTRRRSELGAVELKRATVEQKERALAEREAVLDERERHHQAANRVELAFVPGERYRLVEISEDALEPGTALAVDGVEHLVSRIGRSPLPGDGRRCAYLVRGGRVRGGNV